MRDDRGLTLVEVIMAMLVSFIVFLGLTETILVALDVNLRNAMRDESVRVGESEMNTVRALPFDNVVVPSVLLPSSSTVSRNYRHMTLNYTVARSVSNVGANMRQVVVTVSWTRGGKNYNSAFMTIVRAR